MNRLCCRLVMLIRLKPESGPRIDDYRIMPSYVFRQPHSKTNTQILRWFKWRCQLRIRSSFLLHSLFLLCYSTTSDNCLGHILLQARPINWSFTMAMVFSWSKCLPRPLECSSQKLYSQREVWGRHNRVLWKREPWWKENLWCAYWPARRWTCDVSPIAMAEALRKFVQNLRLLHKSCSDYQNQPPQMLMWSIYDIF